MHILHNLDFNIYKITTIFILNLQYFDFEREKLFSDKILKMDQFVNKLQDEISVFDKEYLRGIQVRKKNHEFEKF